MCQSYMATLGAPAIGINVIGRSIGRVHFVCQEFAIFMPAETISVSITLDCTGTTKGMYGWVCS